MSEQEQEHEPTQEQTAALLSPAELTADMRAQVMLVEDPQQRADLLLLVEQIDRVFGRSIIPAPVRAIEQSLADMDAALLAPATDADRLTHIRDANAAQAWAIFDAMLSFLDQHITKLMRYEDHRFERQHRENALLLATVKQFQTDVTDQLQGIVFDVAAKTGEPYHALERRVAALETQQQTQDEQQQRIFKEMASLRGHVGSITDALSEP
jgi:ribosome-associated translation inhibitor RaiA